MKIKDCTKGCYINGEYYEGSYLLRQHRLQQVEEAESSAGSAGKPNIKVTVKKTVYSPYSVEGKNAEEALKNARIKCNSKVSTACTSAYYSYSVSHSPKAKGKPFSTVAGTLTATITVKLPKWKGYNNASEEEQAVWDKSIGKLQSHEEDHVKIFKDGAREIANAIPGVAQTDRGLASVENSNFNRARALVQAKSDALDAITDDGRK